MSVLDIKDLSVEYKIPQGRLKALRSLNFPIARNKITGLVGESGCGKSTLIAAIIGLLPNNAKITTGQIIFKEQDLVKHSPEQMRAILGVDISVVFQDPMQAHNPVITIGRQMLDIQYRHHISKKEKIKRATDMLRLVGISDADNRLQQYPHEFSGGMRQRIAIAMALMAEPTLLIADEPTTALDATLEVQIIELLQELQQRIGCSILFISHHLGVIAELCDTVTVMYAGEVVESGSVHDVFHRAAHPYTQALLACDPGRIALRTRNLPTIEGDMPSLTDLPPGCIFAERCAQRKDICRQTVPHLISLKHNHAAACLLLKEEP